MIYHPSFYFCISYHPRLQEERKSKGSVFHRLLTIWWCFTKHAGVYRNTLSWKRIVSHTFLPQGAARKPSVTTSLWWIKSSSPVKNPLHWLPLMNSSRFILFSVSVMILHSKIGTLFSRLQCTKLMLAPQVRAQE